MRGTRTFRYGPRLKLTAPMAAMFGLVAAEMMMIGFARDGAWRYAFAAVGGVSAFFAVALIREVVARLRGKKRIVVGAKELVMADGKTIELKAITAVAIAGDKGFRRELRIEHPAGVATVSGVMLGTTHELDELLGLLRSAAPARPAAPSAPRRKRGAGRR